MNVLMEMIEGNPHSKALADKFTRVDILSRIFLLSDLIGNMGNFGFALRADGTIKHSIIDFRLMADRTGSYSIEDRDLRSFYVGNGIFSALHADQFVVHVLRDRPAAIRAEKVLPHIQRIKESLSGIVDISIQRVMAFIENVLDKIEDGEKFKSDAHKDLMEYSDAIRHNAAMYLDYIRRGAPSI